MRKTIILIALALSVGLTVSNARADTMLSFGGDYYVGRVLDGIPSSVPDEVGYINNLKGLGPGAGNTTIGTEIFNREFSTLTGLPTVTAAELTKYDLDKEADYPVSASGYILGKYDADNPGAGAYVWYVPAGAYVVPGKSPETWDPEKGMYRSFGLSHVTYTSTTVPEPGILILLGIVMSAIGAASWKISKL